MTKLALLLLALPLAACAITTPDQRAQLDSTQLTQAGEACAARGIVPSDPGQIRCVNTFMVDHYGKSFRREGNGILALVDTQDPLRGGETPLGRAPAFSDTKNSAF